MNMRTLRFRLMLAYTLLIVLGFGALATLAGNQIARGSMQDFAQSLSNQAALLARTLQEDVEHQRGNQNLNPKAIQRATTLAEQAQARLQLVNSNGVVLFDSANTTTGATLSDIPEVTAAEAGRNQTNVRGNEEGIPTLYAASPMMEEGKVLAVVLLTQPISEANNLVRQRWLALAIGVACLGLLALVASGWLAASLTRPLQELRAAALRLAAGDFSQRVPETRQDEFGQVAVAFNHMAGQVLTMIDEQRAFAANASHELRTPLTTIRLRSEALRHDHLDAATAHQYIAEIDDEAARLGNLVEDLISLSRFDAGRAEHGKEMVDVTRLARSVIQELLEREGTQSRQLSLHGDPDIPEIRASTHHVRVVLRNLLSNAVNYTPPGGTITCALQRQPNALLIMITDTGQGIAPEDLLHLFERFFRADKGHSRTVAGAGLGLPLVQSIVEFYGGRIEIESPGLDQGSIVRVWWPLSPPEPEHHPSPSEDNKLPDSISANS